MVAAVPFVSKAQELTIKSDDVKISFLADEDKTEGTVGGFEANIVFDQDDFSKSSISGSVDVSTLNTGIPGRDKHLKTADFFEAETYPKMYFSSTSLTKDGDKYIMKGKMKIKNIEHEETITFTFAESTFKGEVTIQLSNYDVGGFSKKKPDKTDVQITFIVPVE